MAIKNRYLSRRKCSNANSMERNLPIDGKCVIGEKTGADQRVHHERKAVQCSVEDMHNISSLRTFIAGHGEERHGKGLI